LESNLCCEAISTTKSSIGDYFSPPTERIVYFEPDPFFPLPKRYTQLVQEYPELKPYVETKTGDMLNLLEMVGPWATDRAVELAVGQILQLLENETKSATRDTDFTPTGEFTHLFPEEVESLYENAKAMVVSEYWGSDALPPVTGEMTSKVNALANLLAEYEIENFCGIIFVKERISAFLLSLILDKHPKLQTFKTGVVVGHGNSSSTKRSMGNLLRMTFQKQQHVLAKFGKGELNLLVATQVAEEGIDVNPCNVVIRYDLGDTLINYIQSRGRGRSQEAEFIILAPASDSTVAAKVDSYHYAENEITGILSSRQEVHRSSMEKSFTVMENGITVNLENCEWLLDEYCSLLPHDGFYTPHVEYEEIVSNGKYSYIVTLPSIVPLECRLVNGAKYPTAALAKTEAAFELMLLLNKFGELDTVGAPHSVNSKGSSFYIDPIRKPEGESSHRRVLDCILKTPLAFQGSFETAEMVHVHRFYIKPHDGEEICLTIGFVTFGPLLAVEKLFTTLIATKMHDVRVESFEQLLTMTPIRRAILTKFHERLFTVVLRTELDNEYHFSPLCVPFKYDSDRRIAIPIPADPMELINWEMLDVCFQDPDDGTPFPLDLTPETDISELVLVDPFRYKHVYFPRIIEFDKNPLSAPENAQELLFDSNDE
jgi:endoribonuclease Dicer